jgi:hypothetical protein
MTLRIALTALTLIAAVHGQPADTAAIIARMQETALAYTDHLRNFTCVQSLTRNAGSSPTGPQWKLLDMQEAQLDYVDRKEHYQLLKVNGQSTDPEKHVKRGYFLPGGEFNSLLNTVFSPKAKAEFVWDHEEAAGSGRACVFRYNVPQASSTYVITADLDHVRLGHHGMVWADCASGAVTRITIETDIGEVMRGKTHVPLGMRAEVRYAPATIGDQQVLLPEFAQTTALFYKTWTKTEIHFGPYRKYDATSTVKFGQL